MSSLRKLISNIRLHPEIWLSCHPLYENTSEQMKAWTQLSLKLGIEEKKLEKRWKYLKNQYRKEFKKEARKRNGKSSWKYFDRMSFYEDELLSFETRENEVTFEDDDSEIEEIMLLSQENTEIEDEMFMTLDEIILSETKVPPLRKKKADLLGENMIKERKKLLLMQKRLNEFQMDEEVMKDDDYLFLMSNLPTMKTLSYAQKLEFRKKINAWLQEELANTNRNE